MDIYKLIEPKPKYVPPVNNTSVNTTHVNNIPINNTLTNRPINNIPSKNTPINNTLKLNGQVVPKGTSIQVVPASNGTSLLKKTNSEIIHLLVTNSKNQCTKDVTATNRVSMSSEGSGMVQYTVMQIDLPSVSTPDDKDCPKSRFACEVCGKTFCTENNLRCHILRHQNEGAFVCDICNKSFNSSIALRYHTRIHTGEKPYSCSFCQRPFNNKSNLNQHEKLHKGVKPYICEICEKSFNQKVHLRDHFRVHTKDKPYNCKLCEKTFTHRSNLRKHIILHSGVRRFGCDVCDKRYTQKVHLLNHACRGVKNSMNDCNNPTLKSKEITLNVNPKDNSRPGQKIVLKIEMPEQIVVLDSLN